MRACTHSQVRLAVDAEGLAAKLVLLRTALPGCDVEQLARSNVRLLVSGSCDALQSHVQQVGIGLTACVCRVRPSAAHYRGGWCGHQWSCTPPLFCPMQVLALLPEGRHRAVLAEAPGLLDAAALAETLNEMQRLFGAGSISAAADMLVGNPSLAALTSSLASQPRGDRDAEYMKDIYAA